MKARPERRLKPAIARVWPLKPVDLSKRGERGESCGGGGCGGGRGERERWGGGRPAGESDNLRVEPQCFDHYSAADPRHPPLRISTYARIGFLARQMPTKSAV